MITEQPKPEWLNEMINDSIQKAKQEVTEKVRQNVTNVFKRLSIENETLLNKITEEIVEGMFNKRKQQ